VIELRGQTRVDRAQTVGELDRDEDGHRHRQEADDEHDTRAVHCVHRTLENPSWSYQSQSA
jgi:hypothetical protein